MKLTMWMVCGVAVMAMTLTAWGKPNKGPAPKATTLVPILSAEEATEFKTLAKATIDAIDAGKKEDIVTKITALESSWDAKEKTLRPKNQATWRVLDKTLDRAIAALRGSKTDLPKGKTTLEDLIVKLDQATIAQPAGAPAAAP